MGRPVVHWEIATKNAAKSHQFYSSLFDWKIDSNNPMNYGMVSPGDDGGIGGGIFQVEGETPPYVTFYIQVDDVQKYLTKAESMGGQTMLPPMPVPNVGTIGLFQDPDGNCIGLFQPNH